MTHIGAYISAMLIGLAGLGLVMAQLPNFNFNPASPGHVHAHMFIFGNGSVAVAEGPNPFANNALNGLEFMAIHQGWGHETVQDRRKDAIQFWTDRFGIDGEQLMRDNQGVVTHYQISPAVNERAYMLNTPCHTPPEGHEVIDGGFQLFVTEAEGINVTDPLLPEETKFYPYQTNLVYSWLRIHVRDAEETCGVAHPPPEWIVLQYKTLEPAKWTLNAIVFELEVTGDNYFGHGRSIGISAPIVTETSITNRLLNYITFETAGPEAEYDQKNAESANEPVTVHFQTTAQTIAEGAKGAKAEEFDANDKSVEIKEAKAKAMDDGKMEKINKGRPSLEEDMNQKD